MWVKGECLVMGAWLRVLCQRFWVKCAGLRVIG